MYYATIPGVTALMLRAYVDALCELADKGRDLEDRIWAKQLVHRFLQSDINMADCVSDYERGNLPAGEHRLRFRAWQERARKLYLAARATEPTAMRNHLDAVEDPTTSE